jgi:thiol-disulfide isomerase/thioredoxin
MAGLPNPSTNRPGASSTSASSSTSNAPSKSPQETYGQRLLRVMVSMAGDSEWQDTGLGLLNFLDEKQPGSQILVEGKNPKDYRNNIVLRGPTIFNALRHNTPGIQQAAEATEPILREKLERVMPNVTSEQVKQISRARFNTIGKPNINLEKLGVPQNGKPTIIFIGSKECGACKATFPHLEAYLKEHGQNINFVPLVSDTMQPKPGDMEDMMNQQEINSYPTVILVGQDGKPKLVQPGAITETAGFSQLVQASQTF